MLGFGILSFPAGAMGGPAPKKPAAPVAMAEKVFLIDDFESGNLKSPREWWTFDIEKSEAASNRDLKAGDESVAAAVGNYSLLLSGLAKNWYAGGCGTYLAKENQDLSRYNSFSMDIYGNGPGSGTLKVELIDDDNRNWQAEQDPAKNYAPVYDDKFVNEVRVDWNGWKKVVIPFADFVDDNPMVGDDIWNPLQVTGSGGLLQVQFICIANSDKGKVDYNVDNVSLLVE
jgi:hypothetical protein